MRKHVLRKYAIQQIIRQNLSYTQKCVIQIFVLLSVMSFKTNVCPTGIIPQPLLNNMQMQQAPNPSYGL